MSLNFSAFEGKNIFKFSKYEIKEIGKIKYIVPDSINKKHSSGAPLIDIEKDYEESILIDLLNIGKLAFYNENNIENSILDFVNKYSTLGLINDLPLNKYFFLDDKIVLKEYNYIGNSDLTTVVDRKKYFKLFFPTCNDSQIKELINDAIKLAETPAMEKYILSDVNKLLAGSNLYCEPLDMFIQCAKYLYSLLNNISNEDNYNIDELLNQFEVNNIKLSLSRKETLYIEFQITCLKQYIDYYFAKTVAQDINLLKICKFCNKAFLAVNPKAEYDTPQCKNKANVYKSRAKNK
mgnify:FL=1